MTEQQTGARGGDGHLVTYLVWPLASGLGLGAVLGLATGGKVEYVT